MTRLYRLPHRRLDVEHVVELQRSAAVVELPSSDERCSHDKIHVTLVALRRGEALVGQQLPPVAQNTRAVQEQDLEEGVASRRHVPGRSDRAAVGRETYRRNSGQELIPRRSSDQRQASRSQAESPWSGCRALPRGNSADPFQSEQSC